MDLKYSLAVNHCSSDLGRFIPFLIIMIIIIIIIIMLNAGVRFKKVPPAQSN